MHGEMRSWCTAPLRMSSAMQFVIQPARTSVDVSLGTDDKSNVLLVIRDHGKGVPENDLERIFQPFFRVAEARDRESGGVGLGLAIADRVIRFHGGTIRAENAQPAGLKVVIEIPAGG